MRLFERLGIRRFVDLQHLAMLRDAQLERPTAALEIAWNKFSRSNLQGLVALNYYLMDDWPRSRQHAKACLAEADEFLFGAWRNQVKTPEGIVDPAWWKENFMWVDVFEHCLLWGAALGDWCFLRRASNFPEESGNAEETLSDQQQAALVTIAAVLRGQPPEACLLRLNRVLVGPNERTRLVAALLISILKLDEHRFEQDFFSFLQRYRQEEFPKEKVTNKISIVGTVLSEYALQQGMRVDVPPEYEDHIVKFDCQARGST